MSTGEDVGQSAHDGVQGERIAVIAVHGVGDQTSGASAREIVGLLQFANDEHGNLIYGPFVESKLDLPVTRRTTASPVAGGKEEDTEFTRELLNAVRIDEKLSRYATAVLSGERRDATGSTSRIDVYELYWADLSRLGDGILHVFGSLYQLLFHLASIGRRTVELAAGPKPGIRLKSLCLAQDAAEGMIGAVIPVANLFMLFAILPIFVVVMVPAGAHAPIGGLILGLLAGYGTFAALRATCATPGGSGLRPLLPVLVFLIVGAGTALWFTGWGQTRGIFLVTSVLLLGVGWFLSEKLHRRREPGPRMKSAVIYAAGGATLLWVGLMVRFYAIFGLPDVKHGIPDGDVDLVRLSLFMAHGFLRALEILWLVFVAIGWWMWLSGWLAILGTKPDDPLRRAVWTGKMGVFLPTGLFLTLTLVIWSALLRMLPERLSTLEYANVPRLFEDVNGSTAGELAPALLDAAAGPGFNAFVLCLFVALLITVVGMAPSIAAEVAAKTGADDEEARRLGAWLDRGFRAIRFAGYLMLAAWLIVLPAFEVIFNHFPDLFQKDSLSWLTDNALLLWLGGAIVASVGIVLTLRNFLFQAVGKIVDIGLDVDNWLKKRPLGRNPRGRILSRYLALLEHVCRDASYKRLVIVSHSQGTVVSADLLRFLRRHQAAKPKNMDDVPIRLATFGSPLHQLYSLRFPNLYGWVRTGTAASAAPSKWPDAAELGVKAWVNGYRTGDYVGRFVATPNPANPWSPSTAFPDWRSGGVVDYCVGAGAHTHYFDETAKHVGKLLDELVAKP